MKCSDNCFEFISVDDDDDGSVNEMCEKDVDIIRKKNTVFIQDIQDIDQLCLRQLEHIYETKLKRQEDEITCLKSTNESYVEELELAKQEIESLKKCIWKMKNKFSKIKGEISGLGIVMGNFSKQIDFIKVTTMETVKNYIKNDRNFIENKYEMNVGNMNEKYINMKKKNDKFEREFEAKNRRVRTREAKLIEDRKEFRRIKRSFENERSKFENLLSERKKEIEKLKMELGKHKNNMKNHAENVYKEKFEKLKIIHGNMMKQSRITTNVNTEMINTINEIIRDPVSSNSKKIIEISKLTNKDKRRPILKRTVSHNKLDRCSFTLPMKMSMIKNPVIMSGWGIKFPKGKPKRKKRRFFELNISKASLIYYEQEGKNRKGVIKFENVDFDGESPKINSIDYKLQSYTKFIEIGTNIKTHLIHFDKNFEDWVAVLRGCVLKYKKEDGSFCL